MNSEYPYVGLPRIRHELEIGDVVWTGFHSHVYSKTLLGAKETNVAMNIAWVVLLSRTGEEGWASVAADAGETVV